MKKIALLLILCSIHVIGQEKLKIEIDNPQPRVGQSVTFSINVDFLTDYFQNEFDKDIDFTDISSIFGIQSDKFERVIVFKKAKSYKIGPFNFKFNGQKYTTDLIEVNVLPELPMENGLWLRYTEFEGQKYLILEQLIQNQSDKKEIEDGGYSYTIGGVKSEEKEFAELNEELTAGIELSNYSSSSNTLTKKDASHFDVGFTYSIKKYKIKFDDNFKETYLITEKDFKYLPDVFDIGKIEIKK